MKLASFITQSVIKSSVSLESKTKLIYRNSKLTRLLFAFKSTCGDVYKRRLLLQAGENRQKYFVIKSSGGSKEREEGRLITAIIANFISGCISFFHDEGARGSPRAFFASVGSQPCLYLAPSLAAAAAASAIFLQHFLKHRRDCVATLLEILATLEKQSC